MSNYGVFNNITKSNKLGGFTYSKSTNAISPDQNNTLDITIGYDFYAVWISTDNKSRVRGYLDTFTQSEDLNRSLNDSSIFPNNCIFDFILTDKLEFNYPIFCINLNDPQEKKLYLTITNLEDSLKIINFSIGCLEVSKNSWLSLTQTNSPHVLTKTNNKILLRDIVELNTIQNSLRNYLVYSQVSGSKFNEKDITPQLPLEIVIDYPNDEYTIFTKNKGSINNTGYLLNPYIEPNPSSTIPQCSFQNENILGINLDSVLSIKPPVYLGETYRLEKSIKVENILSLLDIISSSFSPSNFSKKFTLEINQSDINFNETATLPLIIDSNFTDVFNHINAKKDIALGDGLGNLLQYSIRLFDLSNQIIIIHVIVDFDINSDTNLTVYLSNSGSLSLETNPLEFEWSSYFPLRGTADDIIRSIGGSGSFQAETDANRGDYVSFDGNSQHLDLRLDTNFFQIYDQYTVAMWVKPTNLTSNSSNHNIPNCLLAQSSDEDNDILEIGIDDNSKTLKIYQDTISQDDQTLISTSNTIDIGVWTFIGIVSNPVAGYLKVNIDGEIKEENFWQSAFDSSNADITLATNYHTFIYYEGGIQELLISNQALSNNLFENLHSLINDPINFLNFTGVQNN